MLGKVAVAVVACAALGGTAHADAAFTLADPVSYAGLVFKVDKCEAMFGGAGTAKGEDVKTLAKCLENNTTIHAQGDIWVSGELAHKAVVTFTQSGGKVTAIAPMDAGKDDATLPAFLEWVTVKKFDPSKRVADNFVGTTLQTARVKVCFDVTGAVTSARIAQSTGLVDYDRELLAYAKTLTTKPATIGDKAIAACSISERDPAAPKSNVIAPKELEARRSAGNPQIIPNDHTKVEIQKAHKDKIVGSFKLCIDDKGDVSEVTMLKSSGFQSYDDKITNTIKSTWKYTPYEDGGRVQAACSAVTFIYSQK